jgi:hypothetical protein
MRRSQVAVIWSEILAKQRRSSTLETFETARLGSRRAARKERSEKQLLQLRKGAAEIQLEAQVDSYDSYDS